jgi:predicted lactoylglutathione lyase
MRRQTCQLTCQQPRQQKLSVLTASVPGMEQRISLITLGVSDLSRAKRFYEALGWRGQEVEQTVFFQAGGMAVVLWGEDKLAADAGLSVAPRTDGGFSGFRGMSLAQNVRSRAEVDSAIAAARSAGASVTQEPAETFYGGYAGYFTDPDGHAWEVAHNPGFTLAEDGSLTLPDFGARG